MSIEARVGMFKFQPPMSFFKGARVKRPVWFYNPLHDLESIWWMMVFFLFNKDFTVVYKGGIPEASPGPTESDTDRSTRIKAQMEFAQHLFLFNDLRDSCLAYHNFLGMKLDCLHPAVSDIGPWLEEARLRVHQAYTRAEMEPEYIGRNVAQGLYDRLQECLGSGAELAETDKYSAKVAMSIYQAVRMLQNLERTSVKRKPEIVTNAAGALVEGPSSVPREDARAPTDNETAESQPKRTKTM
jgi:hypothetical protein